MSALALVTATPAAATHAAMCTPQDAAALIAAQFRAYNEEFGVITRRAAAHFLSGDTAARERDAVARIELYEQHVMRALVVLRAAGACSGTAGDGADFWAAVTSAYGRVIERLADSDFYRTFYNSVTRDLFGTVGVNTAVEFCATHSGRASGPVPIRVYPASGSLQAAISEVLADLPFAEVAEALGCAEGTARATLHQALAKMRIELVDGDA